MSEFFIGQKVYRYDCNKRKYEDFDGKKTSSPFFEFSWEEREIIDETSRSWVVGHRYGEIGKIPKKRPQQSYWKTHEGMKQAIWNHYNLRGAESHIFHSLTKEQIKIMAEEMGFVSKPVKTYKEHEEEKLK